MLMGDFNAQSGVHSDFINSLENPLDIKLKQNLEALGITTNRYNSDKKVDTYGRNLIKMCKDLNLKIVNGRFGSDNEVGQFTCHKPTGQSVVDYVVVSDCLLPSIQNFSVYIFDRCMSDVHAPICLDIKIARQRKIRKI